MPWAVSADGLCGHSGAGAKARLWAIGSGLWAPRVGMRSPMANGQARCSLAKVGMSILTDRPLLPSPARKILLRQRRRACGLPLKNEHIPDAQPQLAGRECYAATTLVECDEAEPKGALQSERRERLPDRGRLAARGGRGWALIPRPSPPNLKHRSWLHASPNSPHSEAQDTYVWLLLGCFSDAGAETASSLVRRWVSGL